jgi:hypothetical protein
MKIKDTKPQAYIKAIRCDRCSREADEGDNEFNEFTSIDTHAGYGSILGDGNRVQVDLCQHCLKETLGPWLHITDPLAGFDPDLHGGEFP